MTIITNIMTKMMQIQSRYHMNMQGEVQQSLNDIEKCVSVATVSLVATIGWRLVLAFCEECGLPWATLEWITPTGSAFVLDN